MFAERAAASDTSVVTRSSNSEQDGVLREGWLHCKLSLQDGKVRNLYLVIYRNTTILWK